MSNQSKGKQGAKKNVIIKAALIGFTVGVIFILAAKFVNFAMT